jgi:preprotein translocase, secE subunit
MSLSAAQKAAQKNKKKKESGRFLQGVKTEMRKVIWPTRKELINYTVMVIVATLIVMAIIAVSDAVFARLFQVLRALIG